ncbi:hypothetical protein PsorP6_016073 [Peronosclerospora sorghi]|uniref:Uncharacterized protein n=1 Tax=Peronosclerospora sorghi TaxID=230839 RepID=A0ACC0WPG6_9STRA|nr:hypothetical protein PsorP6_016073 [Peronosclerospora sorghi]
MAAIELYSIPAQQLLSPQEIEPVGVVAVDESFLSSDSNSGLTDDNICDGVAVYPNPHVPSERRASSVHSIHLKELHFAAVPAVNDGLNSDVIQLGRIIGAVERDEGVARRQRSVILGAVIRIERCNVFLNLTHVSPKGGHDSESASFESETMTTTISGGESLVVLISYYNLRTRDWHPMCTEWSLDASIQVSISSESELHFILTAPKALDLTVNHGLLEVMASYFQYATWQLTRSPRQQQLNVTVSASRGLQSMSTKWELHCHTSELPRLRHFWWEPRENNSSLKIFSWAQGNQYAQAQCFKFILNLPSATQSQFCTDLSFQLVALFGPTPLSLLRDTVVSRYIISASFTAPGERWKKPTTHSTFHYRSTHPINARDVPCLATANQIQVFSALIMKQAQQV